VQVKKSKTSPTKNEMDNQFALINKLAPKLGIKVTPKLLELQGEDSVLQLTNALVDEALENGTSEDQIEKVISSELSL